MDTVQAPHLLNKGSGWVVEWPDMAPIVKGPCFSLAVTSCGPLSEGHCDLGHDSEPDKKNFSPVAACQEHLGDKDTNTAGRHSCELSFPLPSPSPHVIPESYGDYERPEGRKNSLFASSDAGLITSLSAVPA